MVEGKAVQTNFYLYEENVDIRHSIKTVIHYNQDLEVKLPRDASLYGIDVVMPHLMKDSSECLIGVYHTVSQLQGKIMQIERENN